MRHLDVLVGIPCRCRGFKLTRHGPRFAEARARLHGPLQGALAAAL
jgi:hypothetical protein